MASLRTKEGEEKYQKFIAEGGLGDGCNLCSKEKAPSSVDFEYWRIIPNTFPYDAITRTHDMIIPKRHATEDELRAEEKEEYQNIKRDYIPYHYGFILEPSRFGKSIPGHFHLHLLEVKDFAGR